MADVIGRAIVEIGAEDGKLRQALTETEARLRSTGARAEKLGKTLSLRVTAPLVALGTAGVVAFSKFENELTAVQTLLDETSFRGKSVAEGFEEMRGAVLDLARDSTSSISAINKALFDTVSAGVEAGQAVEFLGAANKLAVAGITDIATATDGLTSAINAYGINAGKAESVAAKFFTAQKAGKTTIDELSRSFGQVGPSAAAAGVSLDELLASMAAITLAGVRTKEAASGLKAAMANIQKPTADAAKEAERLGINFSAAGLRAAGGLEPFLRQIREAAGFDEDTFTKLFGSIEALNSIQALTAQTETFNSTLAKLRDELGTTGTFLDAFNKQNETSAAKFARIKNQLQVVAIEIGARLAPALQTAVRLIENLIERWDGLSEGTKNFITTSAGIAAVLGPALIVVGKLAGGGGAAAGVGRLVGRLGTAGASTVGILGKIGGLLGGISAGAVGVGIAVSALGVGAAIAVDKSVSAAESRMADLRRISADAEKFGDRIVAAYRDIRIETELRAQGIFVPPDVEAAASKAVNALERIREVEVTALVDRASFEEIVTETNRTVLRVNELRKQLSDRNQGPGAFFLGDDRRSEQYLVETEAKLDALREALSRKKLADAEEERKAKIDAERERIRISNADFDNRLAKIRREKDAAREAARALEAPAIKLPPAAQEVVISAQLSPKFVRSGAAQAVDAFQQLALDQSAQDGRVREAVEKVGNIFETEFARVAEQIREGNKAGNELERIQKQQAETLKRIESKMGSRAIFG